MSSPLCVVSVGVGSWYERGIERLRDSIRALPRTLSNGETATPMFTMLWNGKYPPESPTHQERPYAFKAAAIRHALNEGYTRVLWIDAADWFVADPFPLVAYLAKHPGFFMVDGWNVGQWCADSALEPLRIDRESAFDIPLLWANSFGFNFDDAEAYEMFTDFESLAFDTDAFVGPWKNENGEASSDPRVLGHRHDQTALSVLVDRYGFPTIPVASSFVQARQGANENAIILAEGM